ncbi:MAG TPA: hypothetical protein VJP80_04375 [Candidatus Saccharimonadales bacterium]|nr:hypothetical protein [Candidatus Saccharimonadales bacterium]
MREFNFENTGEFLPTLRREMPDELGISTYDMAIYAGEVLRQNNVYGGEAVAAYMQHPDWYPTCAEEREVSFGLDRAAYLLSEGEIPIETAQYVTRAYSRQSAQILQRRALS